MSAMFPKVNVVPPVILLVSSFMLVNSQIICPPANLFEPCECNADSSNVTILLYCSDMNLTDSRTSEILNAFLAPNVSSVSRIELAGNYLTRIPSQLPLFDLLDWAYFNRNDFNGTAIPSGTFNFSAQLKYLNLYNVSITSIEAGAFQGLFL